MQIRSRLKVLLVLASLTACSAPTDHESTASVGQALNECDETVPDNRFVDGFPAYAQCSAIENGSIWSNNGIDTRSTSGGNDWILTQRGGGYQCTEWAYRYMYFRWKVNYRHGNAKEWCDGQLPASLVKSDAPVHGDLIVFDCGSDATTGHIAVVDLVNPANQMVTIVEQNRAGRRPVQPSCALCFLHAVANDGSARGGSNAGGASQGGNSSGGVAGGSGGASGAGGSGQAGMGGTPNPTNSAGRGGATMTGGSTSMAGTTAGGGVSAIGGTTAHGGAGASDARAGSPTVAGAPASTPTAEASEGCSVASVGPARKGSRVLALALLGVFALAARRRAR